MSFALAPDIQLTVCDGVESLICLRVESPITLVKLQYYIVLWQHTLQKYRNGCCQECKYNETQDSKLTVKASKVSLSLPNVQTINATRSEEHTSELQSHLNLVCRLLLEKKSR